MVSTFYSWKVSRFLVLVVPKMGIEPTRVIHSLDFESSASTSSATLALFKAVREKGLEPSRLTALVPKTSVYTNFTTLALQNKNIRGFNFNKNYISRYF